MAQLEALFQSALTQHQAGNFAAAANGYASILMKDPKHADAWHLAGLLAHQNGKSDDAVRQIQIAIQLNPNNAEYFSNLAAILGAFHQSEEALEAAEKAIEIDEAFSQGHFQRGMALSQLGRLQDAAESFDKALKLGANKTQCLTETANLKQYLGDIAGAIEDIQASLQIEPNNAHAYFQLSRFVNSGNYEFDQGQLATIRRMLGQLALNCVDQNRLHSALAAHEEISGRFDSAFEHYSAAADLTNNYLASRGFTFDTQKRSEVIHHLTSFFDSKIFEQNPTSGVSSNKPVFIVGMPRSGTTLLQQILAQHNSIFAGGELKLINDLVCTKFGDTGALTLQKSFHPLDFEWIETAANSYLDSLDRLANDSCQKSGTSVAPIKYVIDKMPGNYFHIGFIRLLFPNATIIHCQRDPRDVCVSCYFQSFESDKLQFETSKLDYLAVLYRNYGKLMKHWNAVAPGKILNVVYENLLDDPEKELSQVFESLDLRWSEDFLNFHKTGTKVKTASAAQVRKRLYQTSREKWRHYEAQLRRLSESLSAEIVAHQRLLRCSH